VTDADWSVESCGPNKTYSLLVEFIMVPPGEYDETFSHTRYKVTACTDETVPINLSATRGGISALKVLRICAIKIYILLTYLLTNAVTSHIKFCLLQCCLLSKFFDHMLVLYIKHYEKLYETHMWNPPQINSYPITPPNTNLTLQYVWIYLYTHRAISSSADYDMVPLRTLMATSASWCGSSIASKHCAASASNWSLSLPLQAWHRSSSATAAAVPTSTCVKPRSTMNDIARSTSATRDMIVIVISKITTTIIAGDEFLHKYHML